MRRLGETLAGVVLVAVFVWWAAGLAFGGTVSGPVEPDSVGPVLRVECPPGTTQDVFGPTSGGAECICSVGSFVAGTITSDGTYTETTPCPVPVPADPGPPPLIVESPEALGYPPDGPPTSDGPVVAAPGLTG